MAGTGVAKNLSDIHTVRNYFFSFLVAGKERILLGGSSSLLRAVKKASFTYSCAKLHPLSQTVAFELS